MLSGVYGDSMGDGPFERSLDSLGGTMWSRGKPPQTSSQMCGISCTENGEDASSNWLCRDALTISHWDSWGKIKTLPSSDSIPWDALCFSPCPSCQSQHNTYLVFWIKFLRNITTLFPCVLFLAASTPQGKAEYLWQRPDSQQGWIVVYWVLESFPAWL